MIDNNFRLALDVIDVLVKSKQEIYNIDFDDYFTVEIWDFDIEKLKKTHHYEYPSYWFFRDTGISDTFLENMKQDKSIDLFLKNKRALYHYFNKYFEKYESQYHLWEIIKIVFDIQNKVIKLQRQINDPKNPTSKKAVTITLSSEIIEYILESFKLQNV